MVVLAGDIGGTKTHLALYEKGKDPFSLGKCIREKKYLSGDYPNLEEIISSFLQEEKTSISSACFGVAGPIKNNTCKTTNLPWVIEREKLSKTLSIKKVFLINDLEANAYGIRYLPKTDFFSLTPHLKGEKGNAALISAGTGLGEAGLYWDGKTHHPFATEGGHADFAPRNDLEISLLKFLQKQHKEHVSYERVLSGPGLFSLFSFFSSQGETRDKKIEEEIRAAKNPPQEITEKALSGSCRVCEKAVDLFLSLYGAEAGNLALRTLSVAGIYIGGGIAPKLKERFGQSPFLSSFIDKGRFSSLLKQIPISIILNDNTALLGAAGYPLLQKGEK